MNMDTVFIDRVERKAHSKWAETFSKPIEGFQIGILPGESNCFQSFFSALQSQATYIMPRKSMLKNLKKIEVEPPKS